jgi:hypothetical protein
MRQFVLFWLSLILPATQVHAQGTTGDTRSPTEREADSLFAAHAYGKALPLYARLARSDSSSAKLWYNLGMSAAFTSDYETGARAFVRAGTLNPNPVSSYNAAAMLARLGKRDSAFVWLDKAVKGGFSDSATFLHDEDLASLRGDPRIQKLLAAMTTSAAPCRNDPDYRRFDFWAGNWRVTTPGGTQVGTSHVDVISGGCALLENWRDMRGSEGKSINTFDPATKKWRQFWVGQAGGVSDYADSEWHDKSLSFLLSFPAKPGSPPATMRLTFTPMEGGVVRQHSEISVDGGATWKTQYDFRYHPVK